MKTRIFALSLLSLWIDVLPAQTDTLSLATPDTSQVAQVDEAPPPPPLPKPEKTYEMFDLSKHPSFPGGEKGLLNYLAENIKYPPLARKNNIQGTVAATFVLNIDGSISDAVIIKDIGSGCGEEVLRVLALMPNWLPGEADGMPVRVRFTLPIRFRLE